MNPKISVIIPVYNVEKYLRECLDSVVSQALQEIEIICINDGSTDHSADILSEYAAKDSRIRIITQENGGQSSARNHGMDIAEGKYIFFMDSDDLLFPDALKNMYRIAENAQPDILHFNRQVFYEPGVPVDPYEEQSFANGTYSEMESGASLFLHMIRFNDWQCCVVLRFYKTKFLKKYRIRFHEGIIHEDEAFVLCTDLMSERAMKIPDLFYKRRVRPGSTMTGMSAKRHIDGYLAAYNDIAAFMSKHTFSKDVCEYVRRRQECLLISAGRYLENCDTAIQFDGMPLADRIALAEEYIRNAELADEKANQFLFQKLLLPFRCLRENGIQYTLNRIFRGKRS